ncbi:DUF3592 domain-containing protein [Burkholderia cepacia]|uniref:DUF3592 domain-containing protein n=1 Tax=Burkholderia cepacia TaxID=292 RepID=UPI002ED33452
MVRCRAGDGRPVDPRRASPFDRVFVTKSGERVSFPGSFVTVEFGDTVPVRYDPARPRASATVDTFTNMWLESIISIAFTMAFLYAGLKGKSLLPKPGGGAE